MKLNAGLVILIFNASIVYAQSQSAEDCAKAQPTILSPGEILVGYALEDVVYPLILVKGKELKEASGQEMRVLASLIEIPTDRSRKIQFESYFTEMGAGECVAFGKLSQKVAKPTLFSSAAALINSDVQPAIQKRFYELNTDCVNQGDWPPGKEPPCSKPQLIATSDLNGNGRLEYWYTDPYSWETGFAVSEVDSSGKKLTHIVKKCPGCD